MLLKFIIVNNLSAFNCPALQEMEDFWVNQKLKDIEKIPLPKH